MQKSINKPPETAIFSMGIILGIFLECRFVCSRFFWEIHDVSSIPNLGFFFINDRCIFFFCISNILFESFYCLILIVLHATLQFI